MNTPSEKKQQDDAPIIPTSDFAMAEELRFNEENRLKKEEKEKSKKNQKPKYFMDEDEERKYKTLINSIKELYPEPYVEEVIKDHADILCKRFWPKWYKITCAVLFFTFCFVCIAELWYCSKNGLPKDNNSVTYGSFTITSSSLLAGQIMICNYLFCFILMFLLRIWARKEFEGNIRDWCDNNSDDERWVYIRGEKWYTHLSFTDYWFLD